jgi:DNA-directed RNA polymerase subunit RPC12/RpoP
MINDCPYLLKIKDDILMEIVTCKNCGKEFLYKVTDMQVPGGKDREDINCPYCGEINGTVVTSVFVYSYKLEEKN